ncbi:MAG: hypothetical protein MI806_14980 [Minwuiales bacterium]|nr:hypothetical protein [Minwuiales bacterium]
MSTSIYVELSSRGLIRAAGEEARSFLQGIISNDADKTGPDTAIYATLLTPQGKFLFDFIIAELDGALLIDCERARLPDLLKRLMFYRLRAKVELSDVSDDYKLFALFGGSETDLLKLPAEPGKAAPTAGGVAFVDPRLAALGARAILPADGADAALEAAGFAAGNDADYDAHRLALGVPDGSRDMEVEKSFLLESNVDELNGIDFHKGCYVGQELTARTKYRGNIRKRLFRVDIDGPLPEPGTPITLGEANAGEMRSGRSGTGIALLRLELVEKAAGSGEPLTAGAATLTPVKPDWVNF